MSLLAVTYRFAATCSAERRNLARVSPKGV